MIDEDVFLDKYELYEDLCERRWGSRRNGRPPRPGATKMDEQVRSALTDEMGDLEFGFHPTYRPSRFEQGWLLSSLSSFYDEGLITDVLSLVKGGKEAHVYVCRGAEAAGGQAPLLAAKVYRPRMFRNLRNDKMYREGREIMTAEGKAAGKAAGTIARAIRNKTEYGMEASHVSWLSHEYAALQRLYAAGAAVPRPLASNENAVLMGYCGDERMAAPTLHSVRLDRRQAEALFREVLRNVDLMLQHDLIHGDLSAYNILYWQGQITLIDFPQVVNVHTNQHARRILERDLARTCEYFALHGVRCDAQALTAELWGRYVAATAAEDVLADWSRIDTDQ